jgi:peptide/nickel transport system permease protein
MLIYVFSVRLHWLPDPGADIVGLSALVLPAFVLGTALAAKLTRMVRSSVLEVLSQPYTVTARAKGLSEPRVIVGHVLRNAMIPVATVMSLQFASLLTGTIVTEKVFARPGLGTLLLDAISKRNYPIVQGCVIVIALAYVVVNLLTDLVYAAIDPRVRLLGAAASPVPAEEAA